MVTKIKESRVKLDGLTQLTQALDPQGAGHATRTREISLAITSLELSKMWLGKVLKELGTANPYPESKNPANEKIEPTADTAKNLTVDADGGWEEMTHIQKVKWLRAEIQKIEDEKNPEFRMISPKLMVAWNRSYECLLESGMWLGMELGRINNLKSQD